MATTTCTYIKDFAISQGQSLLFQLRHLFQGTKELLHGNLILVKL